MLNFPASHIKRKWQRDQAKAKAIVVVVAAGASEVEGGAEASSGAREWLDAER